jgi:serine/threonine-protein kinase HipA
MRKLDVRFTWGASEVRVGTLAQHERRILFEYDAAFLADPLPISPFKLPPRPGVFEDTERTFGGLHGVFNDSLPDGWGLLLMDRHFRKQGISLGRVTPLDRLAYIHTRGMGALTYRPSSDGPAESGFTLDLNTLADQAERILEGSPEEVLPALQLAGGSPGGAGPKILVGVHPEATHLIAGTGELPPDYRHYVIKFGTRDDGPFVGPIEAAYALMARSAGITVPETRLFPTEDGRKHFGAERFDRNGNRRIHTHTLGGLLHASHRVPSLDYEGFLKATLALTKDHRQLDEAYRRMAFNVLAHNRDDHVKNFSYLMRPDGTWHLAPAYDLIYSAGINGWHTMDVAGEAQDPKLEHMVHLADATGIRRSDALALIERVQEAIEMWPEFALVSGVPAAETDAIRNALTRVRSR